jgi:hypothetical protein
MVLACVVACGRSSTHDGTIALCVPEDPRSGGVLVINAEASESEDSQALSRVLIPLDAATGEVTGSKVAKVAAGRSAKCLGGLGAGVLVATELDGVHVRDPRSGALLRTEAELVGPIGRVVESHYIAPHHRLRVRTDFQLTYVIDMLTFQRWPERVAAPVPRVAPAEALGEVAPRSYMIESLSSFSFDHAFRSGGDRSAPRSAAVGRHGLTCEGTGCRLGVRELDEYGRGGALTPIAGAEVLLLAQGVAVIPEAGALITRQTTLDEATRELALVGFDGKVRWTRPDVKRVSSAWQIDGRHILLASRSDPSNHAGRVDMQLVDTSGGVMWSYTFGARRNPWDFELTEAVVRHGHTILVAVNGDVIAMPIGPGSPRWRFEP